VARGPAPRHLVTAPPQDPYAAEGEVVVLRVRRHIAVLLRPFSITIGVIIAASALGSVLTPRSGDSAIDTVAGVVVLGFVIHMLWQALEWWLARIVVTDRRIFEVKGIFTKTVASMPLWKVTDMTYHRSVWGHLFGYGAMELETAGQDQSLGKINFLPQPLQFYRTVTGRAAGKLPYPMEESRAKARAARAHVVPPPDARDTGEIPPVKD
jgi:uncharacterized membrane protein YdbT with pleckstrin-like domain